MEIREKQDSAMRLLAYSAAAGLGAFGAVQSADAAVVHVDIPDIVLHEGAGSVQLDLNSDGYADLDAEMLDGSVAWFLRFIAEAVNGSDEYSNLVKGNANYIRSFEAGDIIGAANANCVPGALVSPIAQSNTLNFGNTTLPQYMGILIEDALGNDHWGWVRMQYFRDGVSAGVGYGVIYEYAYETTPNTDIVAGAVPEPASLGLLAAGAGAMAFSRRR